MTAGTDPAVLARLHERLKELELLHDVAALLQDDASAIDAVLVALADRLPRAFAHPDAMVAMRLEDPSWGRIDVGNDVQDGLRCDRPLPSGGRFALAVGYRSSGSTFLPEEARLVDSVADLTAGWLVRRHAQAENERLRHEVERRDEVRRTLLETYRHVLSGTGGAEAPELVLDAVLRTVPGAHLGSVLVRTDRGTFRFAAVRGYDPERLRPLEIPANEVLFGRGHAGDAPFFVDDLAGANARHAHDPALATIADVLAAAGPQEALIAPVLADGTLLAAICVERRPTDPPFADEAPDLLRLYARSVGALFLRAERDRHLALLERAIDASSDALAVADVPRRTRRPVFRVANPAVARFLGIEPADLPRWDPRRDLDPALLARGFRALRRAARTGEPSRFQAPLAQPDGTVLWVEAVITHLDQDAERVRVLLALRDVTTLRAQLAELERLNAHLQERLSEARTLEAIDAAITAAGERRSTLRRVAGVVAERPGVAQVVVHVASPADDGTDVPRLHAVAGAPEALADASPTAGARAAARLRRTVLVAEDAAGHAADVGPTYRAYPLTSKDALVGVLEVRGRPGFVPTPGWDRFMGLVAGQVAIAVENTTTLERLRRAAEAYADLAEFSGTIEEIDDAEQLIDHGVRSLLHTFGLDAAIHFRREGERLVPGRRWGAFANASQVLPAALEIGVGAVGRAALTGEAVYVERYPDWEHASPHPGFADVRTVLGLPIRTGDRVDQALALHSLGRPVVLRPDQVTIAKAFVRRLERALDRAAAQRQIEATREEAFRALGLALEHRDYETRGHTDRVVALARRLGQRVGLSDADLDALAWGAYLHDLGKIAIADAVLLEPGRLSSEERAQVQRHAVIGHEMSRDLTFLPEGSRQVVRSHHERWDGAGYPDGLAGDAIPYLARLFALVDVYDALVSERPYKPAWPPAEARAELAAQAGAQFDPTLTAAMLALLEEDPPAG